MLHKDANGISAKVDHGLAFGPESHGKWLIQHGWMVIGCMFGSETPHQAINLGFSPILGANHPLHITTQLQMVRQYMRQHSVALVCPTGVVFSPVVAAAYLFYSKRAPTFAGALGMVGTENPYIEPNWLHVMEFDRAIMASDPESYRRWKARNSVVVSE